MLTPVAVASLSFVIVSYVNVHRRRRDGGSLLIAVISTVEPAARYTSPSGRVLSLRELSPAPFSSRLFLLVVRTSVCGLDGRAMISHTLANHR